MILVPVLWAAYGEPLYSGENEKLAVIVYIVSVFGMMIPSLANLITRLVTGKTRSIYPASFIHMLHNNLYVGTMLNIFGSETVIQNITEHDSIKANCLLLSINAIIAVISFIIFVKKEKPWR
ncbi:MAG: hypothetical protein IKG03_03355 [Clostridiales bacterium]|nr:hypothetical protein [Clostridiales bacterium]